MEIGVHQHRQFQVHPWNRAKKQRTKASQYFVTLDLIPSNDRQECSATVLTICLFSGLLRLERKVRAGTNLQAKGWQHHLSQNIGPVIAGSARPVPPAFQSVKEQYH